MKKMILTILFIVIALLLGVILRDYLVRTGNGELIKIANIIWGLFFWVGLWQLSSGGYENRRGPLRWIGITGLAKALLTFALAYGLSCLGFALYWQIFHRAYMEVSQLSEAIGSFDVDNGKYPGPSGPITREMIDELHGAPSAHINTARTDYLQQTESYSPFIRTWPGTANYESDPWAIPSTYESILLP